MKDIKGTKTYASLAEAFAGESQAYTKYMIWGNVARKEGHQGIAKKFIETGENEKSHAKMWLKHMGMVGDTATNLKNAAAGEHYEWTDMYKEMEKIARAEGFTDIAEQFKLVGVIEKEHEDMYMGFLTRLQAGTLYKRDKAVWWFCLNCSHHHNGTEAPEECPTCKHPQGYFVVDSDFSK
ncbi:MAG: rubrerythrin family protein [Firmicutes bacterium]|nr:rubrerythrin family protein [Bacillota bacterium]